MRNVESRSWLGVPGDRRRLASQRTIAGAALAACVADARCRGTALAARALARVALACFAGAALIPFATAGQGQPASPESGARLFSGQTRFVNGGPPCGSCHAAAGLPFPGGGTIGPDLTDAYGKYGPDALDTVLTTLFFPTMSPVFTGHALTPAERGDLEAFFAAAPGRSRAPSATGPMLAAGLVLCGASLALMAFLGRARLRGVRAPLVRARSSQRVKP